jgi:hypothetical protein
MTRVLRALTVAGVVLSACHQAPAADSKVSRVIGPAGGTVTASDGSSVDIPAGALASPTTITMEVVATSTLPGGGVSGGAAYAIEPEGQTFLAPVTVTLSFDRTALPAMTQGSDLAIFTTSVGTTDHGYWLATQLVDDSHIAAQSSHFSWFWIGNPHPFASQVVPPVTTCGIGGAACIDFELDEEGFCTLCQCSDGSECPGGDPTQCCACSNGAACPANESRLCARCDAGAQPSIVLGVSSQSLGPNCPFDSDLCSVCPTTNPVACASGSCCPVDHATCCGDGRSCAASAAACVNADAGVAAEGGE